MLKIRRFLKYYKCMKCNGEFLAYGLIQVNNKECICSRCSQQNGYSTRNTISKGKETQASFSFEFETNERENELLELRKYDFIPCYDCSIRGMEWKSPIYYNKKSFHAICRKLDKFKKYVGRSCGTHLHVGTNYKYKMEEFEKELFGPILTEMRSNMKVTKKFWGREFNHYCSGHFVYSRYNSFNTRSSVETLEFRLLKFKNAKQYIKAADFCIDTTRYINHFIKRDDFDSEMAKKIGQVILKKYKEVAEIV